MNMPYNSFRKCVVEVFVSFVSYRAKVDKNGSVHESDGVILHFILRNSVNIAVTLCLHSAAQFNFYGACWKKLIACSFPAENRFAVVY